MADDAKKFAVKEKFKARPGIGRIMPEKGNELVPLKPEHTRVTTIEELPTTKDRTRQTRTQQTSRSNDKTALATSVAPAASTQENTQLTQYGTFAQERTAGDREFKRAPKRVDRTPWLFLIPALALVAFVWMDDSRAPDSGASPFSQSQRMDDAELARRADMYRKMTGWKMNRERVDVQIENHFGAPSLPVDASKQKAPDMMAGVPLVGESHPRAERDKNKMISADHPDTRIMYGLQEEQDRRIFDQMAQERFVNEFIENARREGYDLEVMDDGTVKIKRAPSQAPSAGQNYDSY